jgi:hypothetical protein
VPIYDNRGNKEDMPDAQSKVNPVRTVMSIAAVALAFLMGGLTLLSYGHNYWGLCLIALCVFYLAYEMFFSPEVAKLSEPMLRFVLFVFFLAVVLAMSFPHIKGILIRPTATSPVYTNASGMPAASKLNLAPTQKTAGPTTQIKRAPNSGFSRTSVEHSPLEIYFSNPENVEWKIKNSSATAIENIIYWFALVDLDQPYLSPSPMAPSAPFNPLPITSQKIEFINPGETGGAVVIPTNLMGKIKVGDRIFGTASFSYPNGTEKDYWLFFTFRESGWYAPTTKKLIRQTGLPVGALVQDTDKTLESLVPKRGRVEIKR